MAYLQNFYKDLKKRIDIEQKFADLIYKDFRSKRYGLSPCCSIEQMSKYNIKKELCDWSDLKVKSYSTEYSLESWNSDEGNDLPWLVGECQNGCTYPVTFIPNEEQLGNLGGQYYKNYGGINASIKLGFSPLTQIYMELGILIICNLQMLKIIMFLFLNFM